MSAIPIDILIFDVDGTLIDSSADIVNAMNYTLRKLGVQERAPELITSYIGTGVRDLVRKSLGSGDRHLADEGVRIFSDYYPKHSAERSRLYPNVKETLEYFKNKRKFILTNRFSRFADVTLREFGIRDYFETILGGDDENCLKPDACVLDRITGKLKMDKSKALIIGDMDIDIRTGKNSRVRTCWVSYGLGKKKDVEPLKPDYIIDDISQLKGIVK